MAIIEADGNNQNRDLTPLDYNTNGDIKTVDATTALVVGSASKAEAYIANKQYSLMWRDSDLLYQAPRPISVFENTLT
jgi:hypothetical protein